MGQFLQWNPNETNQETDAQYLADSQRASGAVNDTPLPAPLGNKAFYQWSTFCAAFGQMMANKPGAYVLDDSSESALAAVLANILTESDTEPNIISVAYSPTPAFNAADSNGFQMALSGNITSSTISGVTAGQLIAFYFAQDSVGGRTVSWPSSFVGAIQPDPTPYAVSVMLFRADLTGNPRAVSPMISNNGMFVPNPPTSADSTLRAATTSWVQGLISSLTGGFSYSLSSNGYVKFPSWVGGLILQWGNWYKTTAYNTVSFTIPFPSSCFGVFVQANMHTDDVPSEFSNGVNSITNSSFYSLISGIADGTCYWFAVGR
jgi:hypothetical protein